MLWLYFPDLAKAYIHGHYRLNPKTHARVWVESYTDKRPDRGRTQFDNEVHRITHFQHYLGRSKTREALHAFHDLNHDEAHQLAQHLGLAGADKGASKKDLMESIHGAIKAKRKLLQQRGPYDKEEDAAFAQKEKERKKVNIVRHGDKKKADEEPNSKTEYRYSLVNRPIAPGAVPRDGLVRAEPRPQKGEDHYESARHGIAVYSRQLTDKEIRNFELSPIIEGADREKLIDQLAAELDDDDLDAAEEDQKYFRQGLSSRLENMHGRNGVSVGNTQKFADEVLARAKAKRGKPASAKTAADATKDAAAALAQKEKDQWRLRATISADFARDRAPSLQAHQDRLTPEIAKEAFENWWNANHGKYSSGMDVRQIIQIIGAAKERAWNALSAEIKRLDAVDDQDSRDKVDASMARTKAAIAKQKQESEKFAEERAAERRAQAEKRKEEDEAKERNDLPRYYSELKSDILSGHLSKKYREAEIAKIESRARELGVNLPKAGHDSPLAPWHSPLPDAGMEVQPGDEKYSSGRSVVYRAASEAYAAIPRTALEQGLALYLHVLPSTETHHGAARLLPEDQDAPKGWELVSGKAYRPGFQAKDQAIKEIQQDLMRSPLLATGDAMSEKPKAPETSAGKPAPAGKPEGPGPLNIRDMPDSMTGQDLTKLMRKYKRTIRGVSETLGVSMSRVRDVMNNGLPTRAHVMDWAEAIVDQDGTRARTGRSGSEKPRTAPDLEKLLSNPDATHHDYDAAMKKLRDREQKARQAGDHEKGDRLDDLHARFRDGRDAAYSRTLSKMGEKEKQLRNEARAQQPQPGSIESDLAISRAKNQNRTLQEFNPVHAIRIAADNIKSLRRSDVDRVLTQGSAHTTEEKHHVAAYIKQHRPELSDEVDSVLEDEGIPMRKSIWFMPFFPAT
jgi:hypothetical protein